MVSDTPDTNGLAPCSINQLANITVHTCQMLVSNVRTCVFHMEDDMQVYFTK